MMTITIYYSRFNPCFNGYSTLTCPLRSWIWGWWNGFNPCFNGYSTLTRERCDLYGKITSCFNPCFNGYSTLTRTFEKILYLSVLQRFFQTLKSHFLAYFLLFFAVFWAFSVTPSLHFYWLSIDFSLIFLFLVVVGIFTTNLFYHIFLIFQNFF